MFEGFSEETLRFLWGIRLNNERSWFLEHKEEYQRSLYEPLKALAAQSQEALHARFPRLLLNVHTTRIYRDARRLHGRGPYKDDLWFVLREEEEEWTETPVFYFEISPEGYEYGMGYYSARPSVMEQYRRRILREPKELETLARRLNRQKQFVLEGPEYRRAKGQVSELLTPWFNRKSVTLDAARPADELLFSPELTGVLADGFAWLMPYYQYFKSLELEPPVD